MGGHAHGGAVHQAVGQGHQPRQLRRRPCRHGAVRKEAGQFSGPGGTAGGVHVHEVQVADTGGEQGVGDGGTGTAGTQLHHAVQLCGREAGSQCGGKAGKVGVVADEPAVLDHHGVDGAQPAGVRRNLIQVLQDQLLAGVGDVQAIEAEVPGALEELSHGFPGKAQFQEVDGPV